MLFLPHELTYDEWLLPPKIYVLQSRATDDIFYVGLTALLLRERLSCHWSEAHNWDSKAYYSPKNCRIRKERKGIRIKTLFYASSYAAEWYELASIQLLSETYQLTNVKKQIHKYLLIGGRDAYDKIMLETREKLQSSPLVLRRSGNHPG